MDPRSVFITEGNVEIYLSKLHIAFDAIERDKLMRLLADEEARMGASREHVENGEKRVMDGRRRLKEQRLRVAQLSPENPAEHPHVFVLETLEKTQALLEEHLKLLRARREQTKL